MTNCSVEDCEAPHFGLGFCAKHHRRWYRHRDLSVDARKAKNGLRVCTICNQEKSELDFSLRSDRPEYRLSRCKSCEAIRKKKRIQERRAWLNAYKTERGCTDCGYCTHPAALDFDHLPGFTKLHGVGKMILGFGMQAILEEIAKCEVVCANCHRVRTAERRTAS